MKKNYGFRTRMLTFNMILMACLVISVFVVFVVYYIEDQNDKYLSREEQTMGIVSSNFEQTINTIDVMAVQLSNNVNVKDTFGEIYADKDPADFFESDYLMKNDLYQLMVSYFLKVDFVERICMYNDYGDFLYTGIYMTPEEQREVSGPNKIKALNYLLKRDTYKYKIYFYNRATDTNSIDKDSISIIRPVRSSAIGNRQAIGYVEIQVSMELLEERFDFLTENEEVTLYLYGNPFLTIGDLSQHSEQELDVFEVNGVDDFFDIKMRSYNTAKYNVVTSTIFIVSLLVIAFLVLIFFVQKIFVNRITDPLIKLCNRVEHEKNLINVFDDKRISRKEDELTELDNAFNVMLQTLEENVDNLVNARMGELNAQVMALQAQINPHFIHNTLAVIAALPDVGEAERVYDLCMKLSNIIRYSADYTQTKVTMDKEIMHIQTYLEIIKARYEDAFSYKIEVNDCDDMLFIPKFILQPIVENSLQHSLKKKKFPWKIQVDFEREDDKWWIEISDNGKGIEQDKILQLKSKLDTVRNRPIGDILNEIKIGGFSLVNVMIRMYVEYGDDFIFDVYQNEEGGTTVKMGGSIEND